MVLIAYPSPEGKRINQGTQVRRFRADLAQAKWRGAAHKTEFWRRCQPYQRDQLLELLSGFGPPQQ